MLLQRWRLDKNSCLRRLLLLCRLSWLWRLLLLLADGLLRLRLLRDGRLRRLLLAGGLRWLLLAGGSARLAGTVVEDTAGLQGTGDLRSHRLEEGAGHDVLEAMLRHQLAGDELDARAEGAVHVLPSQPVDR